MTTKSHYHLGLSFINQGIVPGGPKQRAAFLFGCIEPDLNPATYLKGSVSGEKLRGHNFPNRMPYIEKMILKISGMEPDHLLFYYRLGKLSHYLADAFTYPHNPTFAGTLKEHVCYERLQEPLLMRELETCDLKARIWQEGDLFREVSKKHSKYMAENAGAMTDIRFVLEIVPAVVKHLCPEHAARFYLPFNFRKSSV